jgi:hypothetical protein
LTSGAAMLFGGWLLLRLGQHQTVEKGAHAGRRSPERSREAGPAPARRNAAPYRT